MYYRQTILNNCQNSSPAGNLVLSQGVGQSDTKSPSQMRDHQIKTKIKPLLSAIAHDINQQKTRCSKDYDPCLSRRVFQLPVSPRTAKIVKIFALLESFFFLTHRYRNREVNCQSAAGPGPRHEDGLKSSATQYLCHKKVCHSSANACLSATVSAPNVP